jgi:peptidoglycan/xylan/chitin deacetylase (PgdA/CDA1 family)
MKRWIKKRPLRFIKRGVSAFLICGIVAMPLILTGWQWSRIALGDTTRKATPLPAMQQRKPDNNSAPRLFQEPLISVTFDDGWESIYKTAVPELQKYGIHTTQYVLTGTESYPGYMSWNQIKSVQSAGHEIACHSVNHPDLTTLTYDDLQKQLTGCKDQLGKQINGPVTGFASPYGSYNSTTIAAIKKVYGSQRNINGIIADGISDADVNLEPNFDRYNIIGVTVRRETTVEQLQQLVNYAAQRDGWLVLTYHQADDGPSQYGIDPAAMDKQLAYLSGTPYRIVTIGEAIKSIDNQAGGGK